ncbi:Winged-helix DNA-binding transcription factor family protein [Hirschfeldia incana]|nr:Winged-helix DNA-binding transcription factor family protein [Hirschfeldia incana]
MDPSLSSDPHRPPQYTPFSQFPPSNNPFVSAPNLPFYGANQTPFNVSQPQPQTQTQTQTPPSQAPPPYSELIVEAIANLNEPEGSSKMAISRYIERSNPVLPTAHQNLLAHHLKTLKSCGVLSMVKKSYKLATSSSAPESVAVAAAAAAAGLAAPRSETPPSNNNPGSFDPATLGSASQPLKRGRGRPPKPKPEASSQQQLINVQPNAVQLNGQQSWEQQPLASPTQTGTDSVKRGPGRPRKDGSAPIPRPAVGMSVIMKRRGRPPGRRAAGRQRKPLSVSSSASVFPYVANGARRRGRPRRVDSGGVPSVVAPAGGEAVAPGIKRGRGRPPKIGGVKNRLIAKPKRGRGRPVGRPRKNPWPVTGATGAVESAAYGELKAKLDLCNEKAKEILNALNAGIANNDSQAAAEAAEKLRGLVTMLAVEQPQTVVEEVQPEEAAPQTDEAEEPQGEGEGEGHGQEREGEGGEEDQGPTAQTQVQTDAEAMQEALF